MTYITQEYYQLIFPHNFSSGDYSFVDATNENNIVGLIHPIQNIEDTPEDGIPYEYLVDTMVDNILEAMEC